jgi:hypothetical protein
MAKRLFPRIDEGLVARVSGILANEAELISGYLISFRFQKLTIVHFGNNSYRRPDFLYSTNCTPSGVSVDRPALLHRDGVRLVHPPVKRRCLLQESVMPGGNHLTVVEHDNSPHPCN